MTKTKKRRARQHIDRPRQAGAPFTIDQAAAELNLAPRTIRARIKKGQLRCYHDGRVVRIPEAEIEQYKARVMDGQPVRLPLQGTGLSVRRHLKSRRPAV